MRHPKSVKNAQDILYTNAGELNEEKIIAILKDYEPEDGQIRQISFDGGPLGAWVNASVWDDGTKMYLYQWLYIAAGDRDNRLMIAQAAQ